MSPTFTLGILAKFGEFFWSPGGIRTRKSFRQLASESWQAALVAFLEGYAFERQGRSPHYPKAAAQAVQMYSGDIPREDFEGFIWEQFQHIIHAPQGKGANERNNPLARSSRGQKSITALVASLNHERYNLIRWAEEGLRSGQVISIYDELQRVRGLGPKIVSLFLRDVAIAFEMNEFDLEPERHLQPIDRWTQRGAEVLASQMRKPKPESSQECAAIIVEASRAAGVRPSLVNAGL